MQCAARLRKSRDEIDAKRESRADMMEAKLEGEQVYLAAMAPPAMCRQRSRSAKSLENSMYYVCAICERPHVTRKLIQVVKDAKRETLPICLRDLKGLLNNTVGARCVTEGMVIERLCKGCFCDIIGSAEMSESKFHDYCMAADAEMIRMETGLVKTTHKDYKAAAAYLVKSSGKLFNNPFKHASDDRTAGLLEQLSETGRLDGSVGCDEAEGSADQKNKKTKFTVPMVSKLLHFCVQHPEAKTGIPAVTDLVQKLCVTELMVIDKFCKTCFREIIACQRQCLLAIVSLPK